MNREASLYNKRSADQGLIKAMEKYASMLRYGRGIETDMKEVAHYYQIAVYNGSCEARWQLILMLEKGTGVLQDLKKAAYYTK